MAPVVSLRNDNLSSDLLTRHQTSLSRNVHSFMNMQQNTGPGAALMKFDADRCLHQTVTAPQVLKESKLTSHLIKPGSPTGLLQGKALLSTAPIANPLLKSKQSLQDGSCLAKSVSRPVSTGTSCLQTNRTLSGNQASSLLANKITQLKSQITSLTLQSSLSSNKQLVPTRGTASSIYPNPLHSEGAKPEVLTRGPLANQSISEITPTKRRRPQSHENELHEEVAAAIKRTKYSHINWEELLAADDVEQENVEVMDSEDMKTKSSTADKPDDPVLEKKKKFVNAVSGSLLRAPNFKSLTDETRKAFVVMCEEVAELDPEFILKVALYTRRDLMIRTTTNFLLAFAAKHEKCRSHLLKYFNASVMLPSDWIEVAEVYQTFQDKRINFGSLPSALRRAMVQKFPQFDTYQLAKYNKDKKKPQKKEKTKTELNRERKGKRDNLPGTQPPQLIPDEDSEGEDDETRELKTFTLKQLIRQLHINNPVEPVMCLLGKKYPSNQEEFRQSRLPGMFEEKRAGKRMKLPIPETWETQISMHGNKAPIWQQLLDNKKLPFMAMLRNIRNMLKTGVSEQHHQMILKKLTDTGSVISSKQFPFRFFSAFQVLDDLEVDYEKHQESLVKMASDIVKLEDISVSKHSTKKKTAKQRRLDQKTDRLKKRLLIDLKYDKSLLDRYRKALDTSVRIATDYNIPPISGGTLILCNGGASMFQPCSTARGLGKPKQVVEIGILLALMCKHACESCDFILYMNGTQQLIEDSKSGILEETASLVKLATAYKAVGVDEDAAAEIPKLMLQQYLVDRKHFDNIIVLSDGLRYDRPDGVKMEQFLQTYRHHVNSRVLFVSIDLSSKNTGLDSAMVSHHPNDVFLAGFSDQILRFVAERGDSGQMTYVDNIDLKYNLIPQDQLVKRMITERSDTKQETNDDSDLIVPIPTTPRWRVARVFISSTFLDMHGERDILTRFVFPEIRNWARRRLVNVLDVDLRWGVTEHDANKHGSVFTCLNEVLQADYFIGILGCRYGWRPDTYESLPPHDQLGWIKALPPNSNLSITELEFTLAKRTKDKKNIFYFLRDPEFTSCVPKKYAKQFASEDQIAKEKIEMLRSLVMTTGSEVFENYPANWGGIIDGKPMAGRLDEFATRAVNMIKTAIMRDYPVDLYTDELTEIQEWQDAMISSKSEQFKGRKSLVRDTCKLIADTKSGVILLHGHLGTGKTSLMAHLCDTIPKSGLFAHIVCTGHTDAIKMLQRACKKIGDEFSLPFDLTDDYHSLCQTFHKLLEQVSQLLSLDPSTIQESNKYTLVIDGVNYMSAQHQANTAGWLPSAVPQNIRFILSCVSDTTAFSAIKARADSKLLEVKSLDVLDKAALVKESLARHGKQLNEDPFNNQMKMLTGKRGASNPLYLMLACQELRYHGVYEQVTKKLREIPQTLPHLLHYILASLENEFGVETISKFMSLLYCLPNGVTFEDMRHLLYVYLRLPPKFTFSQAQDLTSSCEADDMVPNLVLTLLVNRIEVFLEEHQASSILKLIYQSMFQAIKNRYMKPSDLEAQVHSVIASYYLSKVTERAACPFDKRYYEDVVHHLKCCHQIDEVKELLTNLKFLYNKCKLNLVYSLNQDYSPDLPIKSAVVEKKWSATLLDITDVSQFIYKNTHILLRSPNQLVQLALNEPYSSRIYRSVQMDILASPNINVPYFDWLTKPQRANRCLATIQMPTVVTCMACSPDGRFVALGAEDCKVHIYNLDTCQEKTTLLGHAHVISHVAYISSSQLMSSSHDSSASIWDVNTGHRLSVLNKHNRRVSSCLPVKRGLLTAGWDGAVYLWRRDGRFKEEICKIPTPINAMAIHPDEVFVALACWDSTIKVYSVLDSKRLAVLHGHISSVRSISYSVNGQFISSASLNGEVNLWSASNGSKMGSYDGHSLPVRDLSFSSTGDQLITASEDSRIKVWSGQLGRCMALYKGSDKFGSIHSVSVNVKTRQVAAGTHSGHLFIFDMDYMSIARTDIIVCNNTPVSGVCWDTSNNDVICCTESGILARYKTLSEQLDVWMNKRGVTSFLSVACSSNWRVAVTDSAACVLVTKFGENASHAQSSSGHSGAINSASFNYSGDLLATGGSDCNISVWRIMENHIGDLSMELVTTVTQAHNDWVTSVCWTSSSLNQLASGSVDCHVKLWDFKNPDSHKLKQTLVGHEAAVTSVSFDNGCLVSTSFDGIMKVWSPKGTLVTSIKSLSGALNSCSLGFCMTQSESSALDSEPNPTNWSSYMEFEDESNTAKQKKAKSHAAEYKKNMFKNIVVAVGSHDGDLQLWNPVEANETEQFITSSAALSICTSGNRLCSSHLDKSVRIWSLPEVEVSSQMEHKVGAKADHHQITATVMYDNMIITGTYSGVVTLWCNNAEDIPEVISTLQCSDKCISSLHTDMGMILAASEDGNIYKLSVNRNSTTGNCVLRKVSTVAGRSGEPIKTIYQVKDNTITYVDYDDQCYELKTDGRKSTRFSMSMVRTSPSVNVSASANMLTMNQLDNIKGMLDRETWITAVDEAAVATDDGQLVWIGETEPVIQTCHTDRITTVMSVGQYRVTTSLDASMKIWHCSQDRLMLVGVLHLPAPVTRLCVDRSDGRSKLYVGDRLGNLHAILWSKSFTHQTIEPKTNNNDSSHHSDSSDEWDDRDMSSLF